MAYLSPDLVQKALSISSNFKNGGMVAKFQDGGDVTDYESEAYGVESSVSSTAASEDIGTPDEDRGPGDSDDIDFPDEFEVPDPDKYDYGPGPDDSDGGDRVVSETVLGGDTPTAAEAIMDAQGRSKAVNAVETLASELNIPPAAAAELLSPSVKEKEEEVSVTKAATQVDPVNFVDADDMAGIGGVAPRSAVQAPPSGGIGDLGPVTPDELDEAEDIRGRQAALVEDLDTADDLGTFGEEEMLSGVRELQDKKGVLAGLGVFAGSPALAAGPFARDIYKTLANPDVKAGELLAGKGLGRDQTAEEVVDEEGRRVGVVVSDPFGVVSVQPTSFKNAFDPALRDAYNKLNERESEEREARGDDLDREPITEEDVAVEEEATTKLPPTIDIIPFRPEDFYYFNPQRRYPYGVPSLMNMRTR